MEHTEGKLKVRVVKQRGWSVQIVNKETKRNMLQDYSLDIAEANAQELVRRWDAFEEGGIVDELLEACKAQEEADNWYGASDTGRKLKNVAKELRQSAITKAKQGSKQ